jgi:hypothetical protein
LKQLAFVVHDILRVQKIDKGVTIPQQNSCAGATALNPQES